jgi:hypothetical protein
LRPYVSKIVNPPEKVSELIEPALGQWNVEKLNLVFLPMDVEVIREIPISTRVQGDFWAWHFEMMGMFSVRSAYRMLISIKKRREDWLDGRADHSNCERDSKMWTKLWKTKVP